MGVLALLLAWMFRASFAPEQVLFSNDGPLGLISAQADNRLAGFSGYWQPLNWIGNQGPSSLPTLSQGLFIVAGPVGFSKFYAPFAILILGIAATILFVRLGFSPFVSVLGGIAAAFSTDFFSYACWGLGSLTLCIAFSFFALAALSAGRSAVWFILGGLAVGMGIMEGFDSGAIMSLYVAAFVLFRAWVERTKDPGRALGSGIVRVAIVAIFAAFMAAQALSTLIGTQITGISGTQQADAAKEERWDFATQWSLPKIETLRVIIPGLYGYRMDTPDGGAYWGTVGQQPGWEKHRQGIVRYSGAGFYVGILVALFAAYGIVESFRKDSVLTPHQKSFVRFWAAAAVISLLFSFGRHAPFYQIVYSLPYFSTIRNPVKFMHPFSLSVVILFGYGLHSLLARSKAQVAKPDLSAKETVQLWWKAAKAPDRKWVLGCVGVAAAFAVGMLILSSSSREFTSYLANIQIAPSQAAEILSFALMEIGWSLLLWVLTLVTVVLMLAGRFSGKRFVTGAGLITAILIFDMYRANAPWVVHYNYREKYASNPVIEFLKQNPHEHRVTSKFSPFSGAYILSAQDQMNQIYAGLCNEWLQHQFQFYKIQSLDIIQMPRVPELDKAFLEAFQARSNDDLPRIARLWQLTNTRFILGEAGFIDYLNRADSSGEGFKISQRFDIGLKNPNNQPTSLEDFTSLLSTNGRYAIFDFEGAMPRAALVNQWMVETNDTLALQRLTDPGFNPEVTAIVGSAATHSSTSTNSPGSVKIDSYRATSIDLSADVKTPALLVLSDKYDPQWTVTVDGKPEKIVRANFIMRGVFLEPGTHAVRFTFRTSTKGLYITLSAIALGLVLCVFVGFRRDAIERTQANV